MLNREGKRERERQSKSNYQRHIERNETTKRNCIGRKKNETFLGKSVTTIYFEGYKTIFGFKLWCNACKSLHEISYDELKYGECVSFLLEFFFFRKSSIPKFQFSEQKCGKYEKPKHKTWLREWKSALLQLTLMNRNRMIYTQYPRCTSNKIAQLFQNGVNTLISVIPFFFFFNTIRLSFILFGSFFVFDFFFFVFRFISFLSFFRSSFLCHVNFVMQTNTLQWN